MDHETTLDGSPDGESATRTLAGNAAALAHDLIAISELQMQLLAADLRGVWRGALSAAVVWIVGLLVLIAALPVALAGLGLWLAEATDQSVAAGLLWAALAAVAITLVLVAGGWWQLRQQLAGLERSRRELQNNLALLKNILANYSNREHGTDSRPYASSTSTPL
jgi:hypothetical protein